MTYSFGDPLCGRVALVHDHQRPQTESQPAAAGFPGDGWCAGAHRVISHCGNAFWSSATPASVSQVLPRSLVREESRNTPGPIPIASSAPGPFRDQLAATLPCVVVTDNSVRCA